MLLHVFYELYGSHSACYVWLCSVLKMNASFLRRCCLIWKRKQRTFETFGQITKLQGKQVLPQAFETLVQV